MLVNVFTGGYDTVLRAVNLQIMAVVAVKVQLAEHGRRSYGPLEGVELCGAPVLLMVGIVREAVLSCQVNRTQVHDDVFRRGRFLCLLKPAA